MNCPICNTKSNSKENIVDCLNCDCSFENEYYSILIKEDEPDEIDSHGTKIWKNKKGEKHRIDGPAEIYTDGREYWYKDGLVHLLQALATARDIPAPRIRQNATA